jgi:hypothetical protein
MKILRSLWRDPTIQSECMGCGVTIEFRASEARLESDRDGTAYVIKCPACSREVWTDVRAV